MAYNDDPIMNQNKGYGQESVKQERHNQEWEVAHL